MKQIRPSHLTMSQLSCVLITAAQRFIVRWIQIEGTSTACYKEQCMEGAASPVCAQNASIKAKVTLECCWWYPETQKSGRQQAALRRITTLHVGLTLDCLMHTTREFTMPNLMLKDEAVSQGSSSDIKNINDQKY